MDHLIGEHNKLQNSYKTLKLAMLKHDICWDTLIIEDLECPFCRKEDSQDIFYDGNIFIYIDPCGYLRFGTPDGVTVINIMFCPMCGRSLK